MLNHLDNSKTWYLQYLTLVSLKKSNLIERSGQKSGGRKWKYCFWENVLVLVPKHVKNTSCGVSIELLWNSGAIYEGMKVLLPWMQVGPKSLYRVAESWLKDVFLMFVFLSDMNSFLTFFLKPCVLAFSLQNE